MAKTIMTLLGEALLSVGATLENGKLVVPLSEDTKALMLNAPVAYSTMAKVATQVEQLKSDLVESGNNASLVGNASEDYNTLEKIETAIKAHMSVASTDTERLAAIAELVTAYEDADNTMTVLINKKLGKTETAANSLKLEGKTTAEIVGTQADFTTALTVG